MPLIPIKPDLSRKQVLSAYNKNYLTKGEFYESSCDDLTSFKDAAGHKKSPVLPGLLHLKCLTIILHLLQVRLQHDIRYHQHL